VGLTGLSRRRGDGAGAFCTGARIERLTRPSRWPEIERVGIERPGAARSRLRHNSDGKTVNSNPAVQSRVNDLHRAFLCLSAQAQDFSNRGLTVRSA